MSDERLIADCVRHAEALYDALCREFDGFPDEEMRLETTETMQAYRAWRDREVEKLLGITAPVNVTACPRCGGAGVVSI
jgi:hypothetical protein